jgi:hypothetical protein
MLDPNLIIGIGKIGIDTWNNEENQALKQYAQGLSLKQQKEMQEKMLSLQTDAQKKAYADSLLAKAKKSKYIPYYIAGGVLLLTIGITLFVVFRNKSV